MNQSIYMMLGIPYSALVVVGFFVYRGAKKNDAFRRQLEPRDSRRITSEEIVKPSAP